MFFPRCVWYIFCSFPFFGKIQLAKDLLHPSPEEEKRRHKKKRLVQSPNSYFMDVKCPGTICNPIRQISQENIHELKLVFFYFKAATRSQRCSAMLRQLCCVLVVQQSCVSPLEAKHVSQRVSINVKYALPINLYFPQKGLLLASRIHTQLNVPRITCGALMGLCSICSQIYMTIS